MARSRSISPSSFATRKLSISSRTQEGVQWLEAHRSRLLSGAGVFVVFILCGLAINAYQRRQNSLALEKLRSGIVEFQAGRIDGAIPLLEEAEDLLGSSERGLVAKF